MEWNKYPKGTKAYATMGGYWIKTTEAGKYGWKWFCGSTFPTPGADVSRIELPMAPSTTNSNFNPTLARRFREEGDMIQSGEKITFITTRKVGRSFHCSSRDGVMLEFGENYSKVKTKNGKIIFARTNSIRLQSQKNALTEALLGISGGVEQQ